MCKVPSLRVDVELAAGWPQCAGWACHHGAACIRLLVWAALSWDAGRLQHAKRSKWRAWTSGNHGMYDVVPSLVDPSVRFRCPLQGESLTEKFKSAVGLGAGQVGFLLISLL